MLKQFLPWWLKIPAKIVFARMPVGYRLWQKLELFKHGQMESPSYALGVFKTHFERARFVAQSSGFVALEIGPGDTLFSALIAQAHGASRCWLVDVGRFARQDVAPYKRMAAELRGKGLSAPDVDDDQSLDDVLLACGGRYLTEGVDSWQTIPDASVDFIWSQAVLEHIRRKDFPMMLREMRRVLSPRGVCSHRVDLQDHLSGGLNNLRFSAALWESEFMAQSGFYTNRIRFDEMLRCFSETGFDVKVLQVDRFASLPTPRSRMAPEFRNLPESDLLVSGFDVVLRPAG